jgi:hypothetical protein
LTSRKEIKEIGDPLRLNMSCGCGQQQASIILETKADAIGGDTIDLTVFSHC